MAIDEKTRFWKVLTTILEEVRDKKDISAEALGIDSGLDRTFYQKVINKKAGRTPSLLNFFKLAKTLGVKPGYLIKKLESRFDLDK